MAFRGQGAMHISIHSLFVAFTFTSEFK